MNDHTANNNTAHMKLASIPFDGFYQSELSAAIDDEMERMCTDDGVCYDDLSIDFEGIAADYALRFICRVFDAMGWAGAYEVARHVPGHYPVLVSKKTGVILYAFDSLKMPREYNFHTDRIFVKLHADVLQSILDKTSTKVLNQEIAKITTPREGWMPFYDGSAMMEKEACQFDHNECEMLLTAFAQEHMDEGSWWPLASSIIDDMRGNGNIHNSIIEKQFARAYA